MSGGTRSHSIRGGAEGKTPVGGDSWKTNTTREAANTRSDIRHPPNETTTSNHKPVVEPQTAGRSSRNRGTSGATQPAQRRPYLAEGQSAPPRGIPSAASHVGASADQGAR